MRSYATLLAFLSMATVAIAQFRLPGNIFGGGRRPAGGNNGGFRAGGGGGAGCTPTSNYQSGGRNYWVSWRTCGTQFQATQVAGVCASGGMRPVSLNNPGLAQVLQFINEFYFDGLKAN